MCIRRAWWGSVLAALLAADGVGRAAEPASNAGVPQIEEIRRLIGELGDPRFKVRDAAARRLMLREEAVPELRQALKSVDAEVAQQAERVLVELDKKWQYRARDLLRAECEGGQADRAADRFVYWKGPDDDPIGWQSVIDLAWGAADRADKLRQPSRSPSPPVEPPIRQLKAIAQGARFASSAERSIQRGFFGFLRAKGIEDSLCPVGVFVSSDGLQLGRGGGVHSVFVVNGDARFDLGMSNSILICDGNVAIAGHIYNSTIIARGKIKCPDFVGNSSVISSESVDARGARNHPLAVHCLFRENEPKPLGFIKWFTPADVGLEVATAKDAVKVEKLHDGKLPAKGGPKVGDLITAVDGGKVDSAETFRKLLRKGSVQDRCVLSVKRGDATLDVTLDFRAEERAAEKKKKGK